MKNFKLKSLILLLGMSFSGLVSAGNEEMFYGASWGLPVSGTSGTMTYALASKTNTVASSVIDMRTFSGFASVQVTGTAGMAGAAVQFTNLSWSASSWTTAVIVPVGGVTPVWKKGSWARFVSTGGQPSGVITAFYEPGTSITTFTQGTPGSVAWPVQNTITALSSYTIALNTTSPTAIAVYGITCTAQSSIWLDNTLGAVTMCVQTGTSNTPPANTAGNYLYVKAYDAVRLDVGKGTFLATDTKLYVGNNQSTTGTAKGTN